MPGGGRRSLPAQAGFPEDLRLETYEQRRMALAWAKRVLTDYAKRRASSVIVNTERADNRRLEQDGSQ
jgi:hypothetical protein